MLLIHFLRCFAAAAMLLIVVVEVHAQLEIIGLQYNPNIYQSPAHKRTLQQDLLKLYVPEGGTVTFCDFASLLDEAVDSVAIELCEELQFGMASLESCLTYDATGGLGRDMLCLMVCDSNEVCREISVRITVGATIDQPIVDDFAYLGPSPDASLWLDRDVFINRTLAYQPYSIGVATFDGLDERGAPYPDGPGFADALTSTFIDLSATSEQMYLSFFIQPKGLGLIPKIRDSLVVDFRTKDGKWQRIWEHEGLPNGFSPIDVPPDFAFQRIEIVDTFMHEAFQFRFRNKAKNEGLQELWHIDYVRLGNQDITKEVFRDIAFTMPPKSVLSPYTSMPSSHFTSSEVRSTVFSSVRNFDQFNVGMNDPTVTYLHENTELMSRTFIEPVSNWTLAPGTVSFDFDLNDGGSTNYQKLQDGMIGVIEPGAQTSVQTKLTFSRGDEINGAAPNNEVIRQTQFANYFAYDDGTAESAIIDRGTTGQRTTLAVEYHTNIEDKLQGVQIMFPHIEGDITTQRFNLKVWIDSLDDDPEYEATFIRPYYPDEFFDTLQGFTTYDLRDTANEKISLNLPVGKFYIGWEQVNLSGLKISVGYDLNSPEGSEFFYFNAGDIWTKVGNSGILRQGALMIRPIVGNEEVISTPTREISDHQISLYPNPSFGRLRLAHPLPDPQQWQFEIFDAVGQLQMNAKLGQEIDASGLLPGSYLIRIHHTQKGTTYFSKIMLIE